MRIEESRRILGSVLSLLLLGGCGAKLDTASIPQPETTPEEAAIAEHFLNTAAMADQAASELKVAATAASFSMGKEGNHVNARNR